MTVSESEAEVMISTRVSKALHAKILERQREAKRLTGIEPSVSAVTRAMLEEAAAAAGGRKRGG